MDNFFTVTSQASYFGWASSLPYAAAALFLTVLCIMTKNRNHIYTWIGITSFLVFLFRFSQVLFVVIQPGDTIFPYLQFARTTLDQLAGAAGLVTLYYIFKAKQ